MPPKLQSKDGDQSLSSNSSYRSRVSINPADETSSQYNDPPAARYIPSESNYDIDEWIKAFELRLKDLQEKNQRGEQDRAIDHYLTPIYIEVLNRHPYSNNTVTINNENDITRYLHQVYDAHDPLDAPLEGRIALIKGPSHQSALAFYIAGTDISLVELDSVAMKTSDAEIVEDCVIKKDVESSRNLISAYLKYFLSTQITGFGCEIFNAHVLKYMDGENTTLTTPFITTLHKIQLDLAKDRKDRQFAAMNAYGLVPLELCKLGQNDEALRKTPDANEVVVTHKVDSRQETLDQYIDRQKKPLFDTSRNQPIVVNTALQAKRTRIYIDALKLLQDIKATYNDSASLILERIIKKNTPMRKTDWDYATWERDVNHDNNILFREEKAAREKLTKHLISVKLDASTNLAPQDSQQSTDQNSVLSIWARLKPQSQEISLSQFVFALCAHQGNVLYSREIPDLIRILVQQTRRQRQLQWPLDDKFRLHLQQEYEERNNELRKLQDKVGLLGEQLVDVYSDLVKSAIAVWQAERKKESNITPWVEREFPSQTEQLHRQRFLSARQIMDDLAHLELIQRSRQLVIEQRLVGLKVIDQATEEVSEEIKQIDEIANEREEELNKLVQEFRDVRSKLSRMADTNSDDERRRKELWALQDRVFAISDQLIFFSKDLADEEELWNKDKLKWAGDKIDDVIADIDALREIYNDFGALDKQYDGLLKISDEQPTASSKMPQEWEQFSNSLWDWRQKQLNVESQIGKSDVKTLKDLISDLRNNLESVIQQWNVMGPIVDHRSETSLVYSQRNTGEANEHAVMPNRSNIPELAFSNRPDLEHIGSSLQIQIGANIQRAPLSPHSQLSIAGALGTIVINTPQLIPILLEDIAQLTYEDLTKMAERLSEFLPDNVKSPSAKTAHVVHQLSQFLPRFVTSVPIGTIQQMAGLTVRPAQRITDAVINAGQGIATFTPNAFIRTASAIEQPIGNLVKTLAKQMLPTRFTNAIAWAGDFTKFIAICAVQVSADKSTIPLLTSLPDPNEDELTQKYGQELQRRARLQQGNSDVTISIEKWGGIEKFRSMVPIILKTDDAVFIALPGPTNSIHITFKAFTATKLAASNPGIRISQLTEGSPMPPIRKRGFTR